MDVAADAGALAPHHGHTPSYSGYQNKCVFLNRGGQMTDVSSQTELEPANGYESESDHRLHFGLGDAGGVKSIRIRWPLGAVQTLSGLAIDRYHDLRERG